MSIHIYVTNSQPATRFRVDLDGRWSSWIKRKPLKQLWTNCCHKRRWAKHCFVKVYYDCIHTFCRKGHGCKKGIRA